MRVPLGNGPMKSALDEDLGNVRLSHLTTDKSQGCQEMEKVDLSAMGPSSF